MLKGLKVLVVMLLLTTNTYPKSTYPIQIENIIDSTFCGLDDGSFMITGLESETSYTLEYTVNLVYENSTFTSDASGEIFVGNLVTGLYESISLTNNSSGDFIILADVYIDFIDFNFILEQHEPATCGMNNGSMIISNLVPNTTYGYDYEYNGDYFVSTFTSDDTGQFIFDGLGSGEYMYIMVWEDVTACNNGLGLLVIENQGEAFAPNVSTQPAFCEQNNGSILFTSLMEDANYEISYLFDGENTVQTYTSNSFGEIEILGLLPGFYQDVIITDVFGCMVTVDNVDVENSDFLPTVIKNDVTICGDMDGSVEISNLNPIQDYVVSYQFNGDLITLNLTSTDLGVINLEELSEGEYMNFEITEVTTSCFFITNINLMCAEEPVDPIEEPSEPEEPVQGEESMLLVKKFFTPNFDGENDYWNLSLPNNYTFNVLIYDRYGKLITALNQESIGWDGTYLGEKLPAADYWFFAEVNNLQDNLVVQKFNGHFSLIRR